MCRKAIGAMCARIASLGTGWPASRLRSSTWCNFQVFLVQFPGVVGNDGIGEQGQRTADHDFLIPSTPAIDANRTRVNDPLELVDGFPADQYSVDAAAKRRLRRIVTQVDRIPPLPPLRTRTMEP